jgi:hypothetical protein
MWKNPRASGHAPCSWNGLPFIMSETTLLALITKAIGFQQHGW